MLRWCYGLLHNEEASWEPNAKCKAIFKKGDEVEVKIIKIDREKENISLSIKEIADSPAKKFPKPKHAFQYIEDRKAGDTGLDTKPSDTGYYTQFEGEVKAVSPNIAYTVSGLKYTVENGENAVAFELRKNSAEGELVYFFNMFSYDIPAGVELGNAKLYAVQADGKRIEIPVKK
jgi:hypothetical protein